MEVHISRPEEQRISHVGDRVLFTIDAANTGTTVAAQQVQLTVKLEAGLHLERLSDDGKIQSDGSIVFTIDSIPPNSRITRKIECSCTAPVDRAAQSSIRSIFLNCNFTMKLAFASIRAGPGWRIEPVADDRADAE